jgi:hypothetical protein
MGVFEIERNGKTFEVEAPDISQAVSAFEEHGPKANVVEDSARSFVGGLGRGVASLPGLPADIGNLIQTGVDAAARTVTGKTQEQLEAGRLGGYVIPKETLKNYGSQAFIDSAQKVLPGIGYEPETTAGDYAQTIGEFVPNAALGPGGAARRVLTQAVAPAVGSETAGQLTEGTAAEPWARAAGAVAGGLTPALAARAITPFPASAERRAAVNALRAEGVDDITAGQATGSRGLQYLESEMGGRRAADMLDRQGEQFTSAVLHRAGVNANRATPEVIDGAFTQIGQQFDDLAARNAMQLDRRVQNDLLDVARDYVSLVPTPAPVIERTITDITALAARNGGVVDGAAYQSIRSRLDRMARSSRNDPQLSHALRDMRDVLDDAMERSISPADQAAWREARNHYRNLLVIERAATGPGSDTAMGLISPSQLRTATVNVHGRRNYARGNGEFSELARAGEAVLRPLPNSGTAGRLRAQGVSSGVSGALGAMLGGSAGGVPGAGIGAVAGSLAPRVVGAAAMSRPVQALLANQLLAAPALGADARRAAIAQALLQSSRLAAQ